MWQRKRRTGGTQILFHLHDAPMSGYEKLTYVWAILILWQLWRMETWMNTQPTGGEGGLKLRYNIRDVLKVTGPSVLLSVAQFPS